MTILSYGKVWNNQRFTVSPVTQFMIDAQGFRPNVGIVISNPQGKLLWARRVGGRDAWQFPQGGVHEGESAEEALYRELEEEVGLRREAVELIGSTRGWLRYRLPKRYLRTGQEPLCVGQKQKWFLLRMLAPDDAVSLDHNVKPEFDHWQWVSYWYPLDQVVYFKREVYRRALKELAAYVPRESAPLEPAPHACISSEPGER